MRSSWLLVVLIVGCQQHHDPPRGKSQSTKAGGKTLPADVEGTARVPAEVTPPPISPAERRQRAVGDLRDLSPYEQAAFQPDSPAFEALGRPGEGDWRAAFRERPQSFTEYQFAPGNRATDRRNHLYLQPVGSTRLSPKLSYRQLSELLQAFFGLEVELLPVRPTSHFARGARKAPWGLQLSTPGVFAALRARIPADAYGVVAVTRADLYPDASFNFVFGQATFADRIGTFSVNRFDDPIGDAAPSGARFRKRAYTIAAHEIGHMFGLPHCSYYRCLMNGSNSLRETDASPMHLCPVCLRKLHHVADLDLHGRYQRLSRVLTRHGLRKEADWYRRRASELAATAQSPKKHQARR